MIHVKYTFSPMTNRVLCINSVTFSCGVSFHSNSSVWTPVNLYNSFKSKDFKRRTSVRCIGSVLRICRYLELRYYKCYCPYSLLFFDSGTFFIIFQAQCFPHNVNFRLLAMKLVEAVSQRPTTNFPSSETFLWSSYYHTFNLQALSDGT